jgi:hypothetical protein
MHFANYHLLNAEGALKVKRGKVGLLLLTNPQMPLY